MVVRSAGLGDEQFRKELLEQMGPQIGRHHGGEEYYETAEAKAERLLARGIKPGAAGPRWNWRSSEREIEKK